MNTKQVATEVVEGPELKLASHTAGICVSVCAEAEREVTPISQKKFFSDIFVHWEAKGWRIALGNFLTPSWSFSSLSQSLHSFCFVGILLINL